jgi:DNA-binding XRE family transcriptional regulator
MQKKRRITSAVEIMHLDFIRDDPKELEGLTRARETLLLAAEAYQLREGAGMTVEELAAQIDVAREDIRDLEDGDFAGDAGELVLRIGASLQAHPDPSGA